MTGWPDEAAAPQLRMGFRAFETLARPEPPAGYALRSFRPGDEDAWLDILREGDFGEWTRDRLDRLLAGARAPLPADGIFFLTAADRPIATACAFLFEERGEQISELGWVAAHPAHRGQGLARVVCLAVLNYARGRGHRYTFLLTEYYRPAAIKTYLRLGFEPEMPDERHVAVWARLELELLPL